VITPEHSVTSEEISTPFHNIKASIFLLGLATMGTLGLKYLHNLKEALQVKKWEDETLKHYRAG